MFIYWNSEFLFRKPFLWLVTRVLDCKWSSHVCTCNIMLTEPARNLKLLSSVFWGGDEFHCVFVCFSPYLCILKPYVLLNYKAGNSHLCNAQERLKKESCEMVVLPDLQWSPWQRPPPGWRAAAPVWSSDQWETRQGFAKKAAGKFGQLLACANKLLPEKHSIFFTKEGSSNIKRKSWCQRPCQIIITQRIDIAAIVFPDVNVTFSFVYIPPTQCKEDRKTKVGQQRFFF